MTSTHDIEVSTPVDFIVIHIPATPTPFQPTTTLNSIPFTATSTRQVVTIKPPTPTPTPKPTLTPSPTRTRIPTQAPYDHNREKTHNMASVIKSITSLLVGLAIEQGYLDGVDVKIFPYFPEYQLLQQPDERKDRIIIEDLLTMRHGMECDDWDPDSPTYHEKNYPFDESDLIAATMNFPMLSLPGLQYFYCSASTVLLGSVVSKANGMSIPRYAKENLFSPLGIQFSRWMKLPTGVTDTAGSMEMRPR